MPAPRPAHRPPSIATRKGDDGTTALLFGQRVPKDHPQIEAVGSIDELNAALGQAKALCRSKRTRLELELIQRNLVALMGEVVCAERDVARHAGSKLSKLTDEDLARIDAALAAIEARRPPFDGWATPGATPLAAAFEVARTTGRRAERRMAALRSHGRMLRPLLLRYVNRVSDLLWLMAREAELPAARR